MILELHYDVSTDTEIDDTWSWAIKWQGVKLLTGWWTYKSKKEAEANIIQLFQYLLTGRYTVSDHSNLYVINAVDDDPERQALFNEMPLAVICVFDKAFEFLNVPRLLLSAIVGRSGKQTV